MHLTFITACFRTNSEQIFLTSGCFDEVAHPGTCSRSLQPEALPLPLAHLLVLQVRGAISRPPASILCTHLAARQALRDLCPQQQPPTRSLGASSPTRLWGGTLPFLGGLYHLRASRGHSPNKQKPSGTDPAPWACGGAQVSSAAHTPGHEP